jgi:hypothetical protein
MAPRPRPAITKDQLYRRIAGCVQNAMNAHGATVSSGSIAKRIVGELHALIAAEGQSGCQRCAELQCSRRIDPEDRSRP